MKSYAMALLALTILTGLASHAEVNDLMTTFSSADLAAPSAPTKSKGFVRVSGPEVRRLKKSAIKALQETDLFSLSCDDYQGADKIAAGTSRENVENLIADIKDSFVVEIDKGDKNAVKFTHPASEQFFAYQIVVHTENSGKKFVELQQDIYKKDSSKRSVLAESYSCRSPQ